MVIQRKLQLSTRHWTTRKAMFFKNRGDGQLLSVKAVKVRSWGEDFDVRSFLSALNQPRRLDLNP